MGRVRRGWLGRRRPLEVTPAEVAVAVAMRQALATIAAHDAARPVSGRDAG